MLTPLYPPVHLFHRANLCWNYPSQNQCFQVNSLAIHHLLASTCINLFSDHHSIVSHRTTTTTVMGSVDHHASWTTIHRIRITCPIVFFSKWPQRVDQVNHSGSTGILFQRPMVSGDPRSGPISVSSALFLHPFPTPWDRERKKKISGHSIRSLLFTRPMRSNYSRFILIGFTFTFSRSSIKSQNGHKRT